MHNEEKTYCYYSGLPSPLAYLEPDGTKPKFTKELSGQAIQRIIEMAWEDRTPFEAIKVQFGLNEEAVKNLMKKELKFSSYKLWRKRVERCKTKHLARRNKAISRFKSKLQSAISQNKLSKR